MGAGVFFCWKIQKWWEFLPNMPGMQSLKALLLFVKEQCRFLPPLHHHWSCVLIPLKCITFRRKKTLWPNLQIFFEKKTWNERKFIFHRHEDKKNNNKFDKKKLVCSVEPMWDLRTHKNFFFGKMFYYFSFTLMKNIFSIISGVFFHKNLLIWSKYVFSICNTSKIECHKGLFLDGNQRQGFLRHKNATSPHK